EEVRSGGALPEEFRGEEDGGIAEDVEVVPFDHVPDCCGNDYPAKVLHGELGRSHRLPRVGGGRKWPAKIARVTLGRRRHRRRVPWRATSRRSASPAGA